MEAQDQSDREGEEALLSERLPQTPAMGDERKVRPFRRRRSSGLLFQVHRKQPHVTPEF
jgi:hypothetical protein